MRATDGIVPAELAGTYQIDQAHQVDGLPTSTSYFPVKSGTTQVLAAEKLTTEYDALGRPIRLGGSMGQYVVGTAWSAYGQLDQLALGNTYGTISWQSYKYAAGSGRMLEAQYDRQTRPELDQQLTYTYDLAGNTKSIRTDKQANGAADVLWQETECFSYDGLNRLKAAWSGNAQQCGVFPTSTEIPAGHGYAVMFEFDDATFNRTKQTYRTNVGETIASYAYPATAADGPVHAPSKVTTTSTGTADSGVAGTAGTYTYTAAGQMKTRPTPATGDVADQALAWDAEHHLASVDGTDTAGDQAGFYDTTGSRVIRKVTTGAGETAKTVTTAYLPGGLEVIHDASKTGADQVTARRNYGFAGQTVATRTGNDPADVTTWGMDSQGTPEYGIANAENATLTGTTESSPRRRDRPFGGDRGTLPSEKDFPGDIGFVGSTRDEDAGILQVGARPYDPYLGLFLTTDPLVDLTSPGSLNAYGYANQNPVTNSDPSGLGPTCQLDPGGSGGSCNYSPATGEISNFTPSTAPAPPAPESTVNTSDPGDRPGAHAMGAPDYSEIPVEDWVSHNADPLADAALDAAEMTLWSIVSALAGAVAFVCGAEAVVTAPTVIAAAPGVTCAGAAGAGAGAAGYQAGKSGGNLVDSILKIESVPGKSAANSGADLVRVGDFGSNAAAFKHYSKHVKGVVLGKKGKATPKKGGADMPEFGSFAEYRSAARDFMGGGAGPGVLERSRGTDILRVDPNTGYFGVRSQDGTIRTFFRPDGDPVDYFWGQ